MGKARKDSRGFTLIAALLLTVLLSGVAVGLLYMVNNEQHMGGNDLEGNVAYYGAEAGMENLTRSFLVVSDFADAECRSNHGTGKRAELPTTVSGSNITNIDYVRDHHWRLV